MLKIQNRQLILILLSLSANSVFADNNAVMNALSSGTPSTQVNSVNPTKLNIKAAESNLSVGAKNKQQVAPTSATNNITTVNNTVNAPVNSNGAINNNKASPNQESQQLIKVDSLSASDQDTSTLGQLKRQKAQDDVKKNLRSTSPGVTGNQNVANKTDSKSDVVTDPLSGAVVTDVMINKTSNVSLAKIMFPDGSYSDIEQGGMLGDYKVSQVSLNGVVLTKYSATGKKISSKTLKRVYGRMLPSKTNNGINQNSNGLGSVIGSNNSGFSGGDQSVPKIITSY